MENVVSVDLWKIPNLEISMKDQNSQDSIKNVLSMDL